MEPKTDGQLINIRVETFAILGVPTRFPNVFSIMSPDVFYEIMPLDVNVRSLTFFKTRGIDFRTGPRILQEFCGNANAHTSTSTQTSALPVP